LVAKVDSAAVQDGFDLCLHGFFVTDDGKWTAYHWHSESLASFAGTPHSAIDGPTQCEIINLTDRRANRSRSAQLDLLTALGPDRIVRELGNMMCSRAICSYAVRMGPWPPSRSVVRWIAAPG
jgi:hypothetical protein